MKTDSSHLMRSDSSPTSPFPSAAKISDPAETLLVGDDAPMVRDLETPMLRLQGCTVHQTEVAAEALRLAGETSTMHLLATPGAFHELLGKTRTVLDAAVPLPRRKPSCCG